MDHLRKALEKSSDAGASSTVRDWMQPARQDAFAADASPTALTIGATQELNPDRLILSRNRLIAASEEQPAIMDRYRLMRTRVQQLLRPNGWCVVGITSTAPAAGKTLTTLNLAITFARTENTHVTVIDADLRKPSMSATMGVQPAFGLCDYLSGQAELNDVVFSLAGLDNLAFIPGVGTNSAAVANPSELLSSARFDALIKAVRKTSALVLIDTPPLEIGDDALSIAQRTDGLLLVIEEGRTTRQQLQEAALMLQQHNLIGTILNKSSVPTKRFESYYGTAERRDATGRKSS